MSRKPTNAMAETILKAAADGAKAIWGAIVAPITPTDMAHEVLVPVRVTARPGRPNVRRVRD
jgi:hypothetical protein